MCVYLYRELTSYIYGYKYVQLPYSQWWKEHTVKLVINNIKYKIYHTVYIYNIHIRIPRPAINEFLEE